MLGKALDKNYTLLCNVIPPGLDARIPLILVGPTGVYVMCVTPLIGMFRARGDQWGTISGNAFRPEKPNLLTRTERMARAIQVYLQRQGYSDLNGVEAVLLCSDPATHVDSMRPIIRVVMRDALERFAVSMAQGRIVMNPESAYDVVNRLLNPPVPAPANPDPTRWGPARSSFRSKKAFLTFRLLSCSGPRLPACPPRCLLRPSRLPNQAHHPSLLPRARVLADA